MFADTRDREAFLQRIGALASAFHVEIHAYALMHTHVHLFVRTREANLGRFMQRLIPCCMCHCAINGIRCEN